MPDARMPITQGGLVRLKDELKRLKGIERPKIVKEIADSYSIRRETLMKGLPYFTTLTAARAAVGAIEAAKAGRPEARSLQEYHAHGDATRR